MPAMSSIWAVAINTVKQALRMKVAIIFTLILLVLLPVMGSAMTGDGTIKGRIQSFICYGLSLATFLLCMLTIIVTIYSVTVDVQKKYIYTVITKPIRRFQFLLGKLLGVMLLDVLLLAVFSTIIYFIAVNIAPYHKADEAELKKLNDELFTARAALKAPEVDVKNDVEKLYKKLERNAQLPEEVVAGSIVREKYKKALEAQFKLRQRAAVPGRELVFEYQHIKPLKKQDRLFVRFKYEVSVNPPDLHVYSLWIVGDLRQFQYAQKSKTPFYSFERKDLIRTFYEIEVPADAVADDGYLGVAFLNMPNLNDTVVIFPQDDGLEVLYKADNFTANFIRAVLLILLRLLFLTSLGLLASAYLSFPVAVLMCLVVFFTGMISGYVFESFEFMDENLTNIYSYTIKPLVQLLPQFDKFNPTSFLVSARLLSWSVLARVAVVMVGIKAAILLLLAMFIFSKREVARVVV
jgi:hypothetical protein